MLMVPYAVNGPFGVVEYQVTKAEVAGSVSAQNNCLRDHISIIVLGFSVRKKVPL
jgi:hypothetical protein